MPSLDRYKRSLAPAKFTAAVFTAADFQYVEYLICSPIQIWLGNFCKTKKTDNQVNVSICSKLLLEWLPHFTLPLKKDVVYRWSITLIESKTWVLNGTPPQVTMVKIDFEGYQIDLVSRFQNWVVKNLIWNTFLSITLSIIQFVKNTHSEQNWAL